MRVFTFPPAEFTAIRRFEAVLKVTAGGPGALGDIDLGGVRPAGTVIDVAIGVRSLSGPGPALFFAADNGVDYLPDTDWIVTTGPGTAQITLTADADKLCLMATTGTVPEIDSVAVDVTLPA